MANMDASSPLGTVKISRLMVKMAVPSVVAQLVNLLYNIVDRIYIGHIEGIGATALTGVGLCLPLIMFMNAFALIMLQKRIADELGYEVGTYTHRANSFHCYAQDYALLDGYVERYLSGAETTYDYVGEWDELMEEAKPDIEIASGKVTVISKGGLSWLVMVVPSAT